jgi:phage N-6-adenine-methyltransferase
MAKSLSLPRNFVESALLRPCEVKAAIAAIDESTQAEDGISLVAAREQYERRIRDNSKAVLACCYVKLLMIHRYAALLPQSKGGRGKKKPVTPGNGFSNRTLAEYRKIGSQSIDKIDEYKTAVTSALEDNEDKDASAAGFLRWLNDGVLVGKMTGCEERYTPKKYVDSARQVMGGIDLDPATNCHAQKVIKAKRFYSKDDDGLSKKWKGRVWLNPPYTVRVIDRFVEKLLGHIEGGDVSQAVLLTNNNTDTEWWQSGADAAAAICFTKGRIAFYDKSGETTAPTNGQTFFYFGRRGKAFAAAFVKHGLILHGDS